MTKENYFSKKMVNKTDNDLQDIIDNKSQFQEDAVLAAIWELEKRHKVGDDIKNVESQIIKKRKDENERIEKVKKDSNITDDPEAPLLFHPKYILIYGALFSVFAGGILMAMNFSRLGKNKFAWLTVFTALAYSVIQIITFNQIEISSSALTIPINYLGIYLLEILFWKKQVSNDLKYRKRSIWISLIIGIVITGLLIYLMIIGGGV